MAVPKGKVSKQRKHTRRAANWKLSAPTLVVCKHCNQLKLAHRVCKNCGYYGDEQIVNTEGSTAAAKA